MTTPRLHDLLHDSVRDATMPDIAGLAWEAGLRARRRRKLTATAAAAVAVAVVVMGAAGVAFLAHRSDQGSVSRPDGSFHGIPVWWAPTLEHEAALPALPHSPLPTTVDLSASASDLATHPIKRAVAAYAVLSDERVERVLVVAPDGTLRSVDISGVKPMTDPDGNRRVNAGPAMLSPQGDYLMFPRDFGIDLFQISTGRWRWLYTLPGKSTWNAAWDGPRSILVPTRDDYGIVYSITPQHPANEWSFGGVTIVPHPGSQPYGPFRTGPRGSAQSFGPGASVPEPQGIRPHPSDWIGIAPDKALLVIPSGTHRHETCCKVDGWTGPDTLLYDSRSSGAIRVLAWQVGTRRFWRVTDVVGWEPGQQDMVSSYANTP